MLETIQFLIRYMFGLSIVVGLLSFVYWRHGDYWRRVQAAYPGKDASPIRTWHMQSIYFHNDGLVYKSHRGIVSISLGEAGITFQIIPPVSLVQKPIFVAYKDVAIYGQDWLLMGRCCQLEFRGLRDVRCVIPGEVGDRLLDYTNELFRDATRPGLSGTLAALRPDPSHG